MTMRSSRRLQLTAVLVRFLAPWTCNAWISSLAADGRGGRSFHSGGVVVSSLTPSPLDASCAADAGTRIHSSDNSDTKNDNHENTNKIKGGALSMTIPELADHLGGRGRARLAWDCYRIGVDPALLFAADNNTHDTDIDNNNNNNAMTALLPGSRRRQRLGAAAPERLAALNHNGCVEGGVATLTHVSQSARDGTTKLLLQLHDGTEVETVIIPFGANNRSTLCVSSQVGCRQGCAFCATGKMGKLRSLAADEMLAQLYWARKICRERQLPPVTNVVFMGMVRVFGIIDQ